MSRGSDAFLSTLTLFAASSGLWGCTSLLGDFSTGSHGDADGSSPTNPSADGALPDGSVIGTSPDATLSDGGRSDVGDATVHDAARSDAAGIEGGTCVPATAQCSTEGGVEDCAPGATRCTANGPETCDGTGTWGMATACGVHQTCTGGGTGGTAATCKCTKDSVCTAMGIACASGSALEQCSQDGQGCFYPGPQSPCTNGACFGSLGSATCCTNKCTSGATQCGGAGVQTCQVQGTGCTDWNLGTACGTNQICQGTGCVCNNGFTACGTSCVNVNNDVNHCGSCTHACPALTSPNSVTCSSGGCTGFVGSYVVSSTNSALINTPGNAVYVMKVTMPATSGQFAGIGAVVGSNNASGSTEMIYALYADNGGVPGDLLFNTLYNDSALSFADPSALHALESSSGVSSNGYNQMLVANTSYWIYLKSGTNQATANTAGIGSLPCLGATWPNVDPPVNFTYAGATFACPADYQAYLIVSYP